MSIGDDIGETGLLVMGTIAVVIMMISYALEQYSKWFLLLFAFGCALTSFYSGIAGVYPITVVEGLWGFLALYRFLKVRHRTLVAKDENPV